MRFVREYLSSTRPRAHPWSLKGCYCSMQNYSASLVSRPLQLASSIPVVEPSAALKHFFRPASRAEQFPENACRSIALSKSAQTQVISLDVEYIHLHCTASDTWCIVPGEIALLTSHGVMMHTFIHPGQMLAKDCQARGGVQRKHWHHAPCLEEVAEQVRSAVDRRTLIGHGLKKDLQYLGVTHPMQQQLDISLLPPFLSRRGQAQKLQKLSLQFLGENIQAAGHSALEDASAVFSLYNKFVRNNTTLMDASALEAHFLNEILDHDAKVTVARQQASPSSKLIP